VQKYRLQEEIMDIFDLFKKIESSNTNDTQKEVYAIIACLGNPGKEYSQTRHNAGFMFADLLSKKYSFDIKKAKFKSLYGEAVIGGKRVIVLLPQTYMNKSGEAIKEAASFYKIPPERVFVVVDDISFDVGQIRIKRNGSAGGHNGLKNIIEQLGTQTFPRIKVGVGKKPNPEYDLIKWVLADIPSSLMPDFNRSLENSVNAIELIMNEKFDEAMNTYNTKA
jgi:PTH1 family peptidyl-tRNA hydrolase